VKNILWYAYEQPNSFRDTSCIKKIPRLSVRLFAITSISHLFLIPRPSLRKVRSSGGLIIDELQQKNSAAAELYGGPNAHLFRRNFFFEI
jgi:hypothetical protein